MNIENCYKMVRNGYFSLKTCLRTSKNIFNDFDTLPYYMGVDVRFNGKGVGTIETFTCQDEILPWCRAPCLRGL